MANWLWTWLFCPMKSPAVSSEDSDLLKAYVLADGAQVDPNVVTNLAKAQGMSIDQVYDWMRKHKQSEEDLARRWDACESCWNLALYLAAFIISNACFNRWGPPFCYDSNAANMVLLAPIFLHLLIIHVASPQRAAHSVTLELVVRTVSCFGPYVYNRRVA